jgi:hypothetical protein
LKLNNDEEAWKLGTTAPFAFLRLGDNLRKQRITVWLSLFAGFLYVIGGLRDIFAPGFFNISPHRPNKSEIIFKFALAAVFLALAATFQSMDGARKK